MWIETMTDNFVQSVWITKITSPDMVHKYMYYKSALFYQLITNPVYPAFLLKFI